MRKRFVKHIVIIPLLVSCILNFFVYNIPSRAAIYNITYEELKKTIEEQYNHRNTALVIGDFSIFQNDFDNSSIEGIYAKEHEIKRVKYLNNWASAREIKFIIVNSKVRIKNVSKVTEPIKVTLEETYRFDYIYRRDDEPVINSFGVGLRHSVGLTKKGGRFVIAYDQYTDCFEDALKAYNGKIVDVRTNSEPQLALNCRKRIAGYTPQKSAYNRIMAVKYANKFCGAANGAGNNFNYNIKYKDFNGIGGDCTNFVSQVVGDPDGGGLKQDGKWFCSLEKSRGCIGSVPWINANRFRNYLLSNGKGKLIKAGTYSEVALPQTNNPNGIIDKLDLGDVICYAKGSNIDHFAIITGWDSHGYPLVNSHTTDRYHVPWDLGWGDNNIFFQLIHIV